jgi:hypothetical protein
MNGQERKLHGFTFALGYSPMIMAEAALQDTPLLYRLYQSARGFRTVPNGFLPDSGIAFRTILS